jgi:O-antigen ligase
MKTIQSYEEDESAAGRLYFWSLALKMSADNPLGVGVQNFNNLFDRYDESGGRAFGTGRSVHNSHLQVLTEAGMFGGAVWLFLLIYSLVLGIRIRRRALKSDGPNRLLYAALAEGIVAAFIGFIVGGTFTAIAWNDFTWCLFAILAALDRLSRAEAKPVPIALSDPTAGRTPTWTAHSDNWRPVSAR